MRALTDSELLDAWEQGLSQTQVGRALALLSALERLPPSEVADWPIGQRDARLLDLREQTFGSRLAALADCPACGAKLEFELRTPDLRRSPPAGADARFINAEGYACRFRLPTSRDLVSVSAEPGQDLVAAEERLLARCVTAIERDGQGIPSDALPESVVRALNDALAEADPQADIELALACPACGQVSRHEFDVLAFFWSELEAWGRNLLLEVHALAEAYGWTEPEVLALSPRRRRLYLEILRG